MQKPIAAGKFVLLALFAIIVLYLFVGTGLHGDDYSTIGRWRDWSDFFNIDPARKGLIIFGLSKYFSFWWAYFALGYEHQWAYDFVKALAHLLSVWCVYWFAVDYLPRDRALLASVLFVFLPLHDTTMYWYMTVPNVLFPAVLMYAHSLMRGERVVSGVLLGFIGAFAGYVSPPYVFGLAAIFAYERKYRKALLYATPGLLYVVFYFWIKFAFPGVERRINAGLGVAGFLKQLLLQPLSFAEAAIGPSYWFKIYYGISSIGLISACIAAGIVVLLLLKFRTFSAASKLPQSLFFGLASILVLSFGMFALTGLYHHSAFNLGNRTTVYGSLLLAFLLALLPLNKKTILFLTLIFILPVFGLSDAWKSWNVHQKMVIENIHTNVALRELPPESTLLVAGNIYSKLGPFSNIEFFSMPWVVNSIFHGWVKSKNVVALVPYIFLDKGVLVDPKFGGKYVLQNTIYLYDSDANSVQAIPVTAVPQLLANRPREIRHWVQLARGTWIESSITSMSPRLAYLFQ